MDIRTVSSPCFVAPRAHPAVMCPKLRLPGIRRTDHGGQRPLSAPRICYVWVNGVSMPVPLD